MLELEDVTTVYGVVPMLREVSIAVKKGELVCVLGPNGAGKSTTFKAITGLTKVTGGSISLMGEDVRAIRTERIASLGVGLVPEGRRLFPRLTVRENLKLGFDAVSSAGNFDERFVAMNDLFPWMKERLGQAAGTLSGGEQAMVALARALVGSPKLIVMDEPSLGLSPKLITEYFEIISEVNRRGTTILLIEQNAQMGLGIASRGYFLVKGRIAASGGAGELLNSDMAKHLYL